MKTMLKNLIIAAAIVAAFATSAARAVVEIGQAAPDFTLTDINGKAHKLSDYKGKIVVLEWMNQGCPFVVNHYQNTSNIPKTQKAAKADGVVWLTINSGRPGAQGDLAPKEVEAWMKETGASPTAYFRDQDGKVGKLYNAKTTPHMYVINKDGTLVYNGAIDSIRTDKPEGPAKATNYVTAALANLKAGKPVEKATSQPYGCSVKY